MTRGIKASEVREGMEVKWSKGDITYQMQCQRKVVFKDEFLKEVTGYNFCTEGGGVQYVSADQEVTVLKEAQPEEPTAFGACVEAGGVWFVRVDDRALEDPDFQPWQSASLIEWTWAEVCEQGPVAIINADPFSPPAQDATEPRKWVTLADIPETVVSVEDRDGDVVKRLVTWEQSPWVYMAHRYSDIRPTDDAGPFIEVRHNGRLERGEQEKA